MVAESSSVLQGELSPRPATEDVDMSAPGAMEPPVPLPRKINSVSQIQVSQIKDTEEKTDSSLFPFLHSPGEEQSPTGENHLRLSGRQ